MNKKLPAIAILATLLLLAGCNTMPSVAEMTPQQFKDTQTKVVRDDFKKTTTIRTSRLYFNMTFPRAEEYYQLIATKKDGGQISYEILLYSMRGSAGGGWAFWQSAADKNGNEFNMERVNTNVRQGGITEEWYSANVSREYLESIRDTGIEWKFYGQKATTQATIGGQSIAGFLMRVDDELKQ